MWHVQRLEVKYDFLYEKVYVCCLEEWASPIYQKIYTTFILVILFLLPLMLMLCLYTKIGYELWIKKRVGDASVLQTIHGSEMSKISRKKKRAIVMMVTVVFLFAVCWAPFHVIHMMIEYRFFNSICNPIVYAFMNENFKKNFLSAICFCMVKEKASPGRQLGNSGITLRRKKPSVSQRDAVDSDEGRREAFSDGNIELFHRAQSTAVPTEQLRLGRGQDVMSPFHGELKNERESSVVSYKQCFQIHCEQLKRKNKDAEDHLELYPHQCVEMESRCESKELDVEIRNLIGKSDTSQWCEDPKPIAQESASPQRTSCSLKLLEVNKQWDHQFRNMKQLYEKQLAEMKARLDVSERRVSELEQERHRQQPGDERLGVLGREKLWQEKQETKVLSEALHEVREENKLLKQKNASMLRKKEHYEGEISRLNKALLDVLKKQHSPVLGTPLEKGDRNSLEEMRTQLEVLRQQVQIYEEDFRKERSDRERLSEEKEALQKVNERLQSQLNKLSSQTKDLPAQPERPSYPPPLFLSPCVNYGRCGMLLHYADPRVQPGPCRAHEQQQHSPDYQWYVPDQLPPDVQHKADAMPSTGTTQNIALCFILARFGKAEINLQGPKDEHMKQQDMPTLLSL
ncbi:hypothetical protein BTVI_87480 [Pitangus sulphuratus]|nr:hypothetical protein BTVI_87480 [Pitangus sulphuratus]